MNWSQIILIQIEDEINNSSEAFDHKLQTVLEDNAKRAVEAGKMDETSVRYIAQGISDKAVSELRTLLEGMIGQMNGTLLAQTKVGFIIQYMYMYTVCTVYTCRCACE